MRTGNAQKRYAYWRKRLLATYGISPEAYDQLLVEQGGVCAVCREPESIEGQALSVDHDHETNVVRGLLCRRCNRGIGVFRDNPANLAAAAAYLLSRS